MFPADGVQLLKELTEKNDKRFFEANKARYENTVKLPMAAIVESLNAKLEGFAPAYVTPPKKAMPRIHRDTRFSADKSPYKTEAAAIFPCQGKEKQEAAGYFFRVTTTGADLLGGVYMPGPEQLARIRAAIAAKPAAFRKLIGGKKLQDLFGPMQGEKLVRVPKGFDADHPAAELLKHKQFYFATSLPLEVATSNELVPEVAARFKVLAPFVQWLDAALGNDAAAR
ncbi:DUF2461 domain-containing protein [Vulgatibacter sp.]|uniref:DUF2461 domain-containing protein n=1 Tax=Vulgatibacter sp. TaxID=1971226 RepID=UPI00356769D8